MLAFRTECLKATASTNSPCSFSHSQNLKVMDGQFKRVQQLFDETKLSALPTDAFKCYLWNCDETGFCTAVTAKKILAKYHRRRKEVLFGGAKYYYSRAKILGQPT